MASAFPASSDTGPLASPQPAPVEDFLTKPLA
jgi:hypothetical protein